MVVVALWLVFCGVRACFDSEVEAITVPMSGLLVVTMQHDGRADERPVSAFESRCGTCSTVEALCDVKARGQWKTIV